MKASLLTIGALAPAVLASPHKRAGSKSWGGTSNYFVQGMSGEDQQAYISQLASDGVKVMRLWVSQQHPGCTKGSNIVADVPNFEEEKIGDYRYKTLDLLDQTLVYLQDNGLKAIISPHDANMLNGHNGNDIYGQIYGPGSFYEEDEAISAFDKRITEILNHKGAHSGKVWKEWSDVIMAFDLQNEPFATQPEKCKWATAEPWICGRSTHMRETLGADNPIQVASGGFGGDIVHECTFVGMNCKDLDIVSVHRYAGPEDEHPGQWSSLYKDWINEANGKLVQLEEWGVNTTKYDPVTEFPANTQDMNAGGLPFTYWQILPSKACDIADSDPFGFYIDSGVPYSAEMKAASEADCPQDWSGIVYKADGNLEDLERKGISEYMYYEQDNTGKDS